MNHEVQAREGVQRARRRLIKGSFAVPASAALISGSAFAAASTQCVRNAANATPPVQPTAAASNGELFGGVPYVRVQAFRAVLPTGAVITGGNASSWVSGSVLSAMLPAGRTATPAPGQFELVSAGSGVGTPLGTQTSSPPALEASAGGQWFAVRVDASGNVVGLSPVDSAGGAVAQTCWMSFISTP